MHELRVRAHRHDVAAHPREPLVLLCQSSELGRSDEGEIRRIEEQDRPPLAVELLLQVELAELLFRGLVRRELEIGYLLAELHPRRRVRHVVWTSFPQARQTLPQMQRAAAERRRVRRYV